jgi:putative aminopeptidase FrvX
MFELLKTLTEIPGMIGHEDLVQDYVEEQWHPYCQDISRTSVGNLVGRVGVVDQSCWLLLMLMR